MRFIATTYVSKNYDITQVSISSDGLQAIAFARNSHNNGQVWVWDVEATQQPASTLEIPYYFHPTSPSINGTTVSSQFNRRGTLLISDLNSGRRLSVLKGHTKEIVATIFSLDGLYLISGSHDSTIRIWDTQLNVAAETSSEVRDGPIRDIVLSADEKNLISWSENHIIGYWNTFSGELISKIEKEARRVGFSVRNIPIALYWLGSTIDVWNAETGTAICTLHGHSANVTNAAFSPGFTQIASGSQDCTVRIWNTATWECTSTLNGHKTWIESVRFSPDGTRVVTRSSDSDARVWDAATGNSLSVLSGGNRVLSYSFAPRAYASGAPWRAPVRTAPSNYDADRRGDEWGLRDWEESVDPFFRELSPRATSFISLTPPMFDLDDSGWLFITSPSTPRRRVCWLPVERRGIVRSAGLTVVLGSATGVVSFLSVSNQRNRMELY